MPQIIEPVCEAPAVSVDRLEHLAAFANARIACWGRPIQNSAFGVDADAVRGWSPRSAHTLRFDRSPSAAISKAVSWLAHDSATIRIELSGVTAMPLGKAMPSATFRAEPSGVTRAMIPGANFSPAIKSTPLPLT
jgi:hypothetical protein